MKRALRSVITLIAITLVLLAGLVNLTSRTIAQSEDRAAAALPLEARQFDFWLGDWDIFIGSTRTIGDIKSFGVGGGIAILENYAAGFGTSVSVYSVKEQKWYQTWYDQDQLLIEASGRFENDRMVLVGQDLRTNTGAKLTGRLSWFNITANDYRFTYELSSDGGQTWQSNFASHHVRPATVAAQSSAPSGLSPAALPSGFRQFDFLKGEWEVMTEDCPEPGSGIVTLFGAGGGFAVLEDFKCGDNYRGSSVSFYSTLTGSWRYYWLDTEGLLLELTGNRQGDDMVFTGEFNDPVSGQLLLARVTYSKVSQSEVGRKFEVSDDGGQSWSVRHTDQYLKATVFQPDALTATKVKAKKVALSWVDRSPKENRYEVLQWNGVDWIIVKTLKANVTKVTIKKLQPATEYKFAVRACDKNRCSQQVELTVTTP